MKGNKIMQVDASFFDELFMSYWAVSKEGNVSKTFQQWSHLCFWVLRELESGRDHEIIVIAIGKQQENSTTPIAIIYPGEILFLKPDAAFAITIGE
jgi:hypothetical protein